MPITESDRLLASGKAITLTNGRTVMLRFGFRGLKMLEDSLGSLGEIDHLIDLDDDGRPRGKILEPLLLVLGAGLVAEKIDSDSLLDLLDTARLPEYVAAVLAALGEALPASGNGAGKAPAPALLSSPGASSTTSAPSASEGPTISSGP